MRRRLKSVAESVCAILLFALMVITCIDVVARYVFGMPLRGGFELTEIMLAAIIFAALPLTTARREHVAFDSFNPVAAAAMPLVIRGAALISAAALAFLGWRLWIYADSLHTGKIASATLSLPMYPLAYLMSACVLVSAGVFAWLSILGHDEGPTGIPNA